MVRSTTLHWAGLGLALLLAASGCKKHRTDEGQEGQAAANAEAADEARQIFATRCTPCHGATGGGDGPASLGLNPRPRNFHDQHWQSMVTDDHIEQIIQYGGAAVGKSPAMPANPDLTDRPAVVAALRAHVRSFAHQ